MSEKDVCVLIKAVESKRNSLCKAFGSIEESPQLAIYVSRAFYKKFVFEYDALSSILFNLLDERIKELYENGTIFGYHVCIETELSGFTHGKFSIFVIE